MSRVELSIDLENGSQVRALQTFLSTLLGDAPIVGAGQPPREPLVVDAAVSAGEEKPKAKRGRKPKAATGRAISDTPEDRVNPDDEATAAQDAADEQAEVAATQTAVTVEDLREVIGQYIAKHGEPATQEDGPRIFVDALGAPPVDSSGWRATLVAQQGQDVLAKAVAAWRAALAAETRYAPATAASVFG